jgi:hypothetical protein
MPSKIASSVIFPGVDLIISAILLRTSHRCVQIVSRNNATSEQAIAKDIDAAKRQWYWLWWAGLRREVGYQLPVKVESYAFCEEAALAHHFPLILGVPDDALLLEERTDGERSGRRDRAYSWVRIRRVLKHTKRHGTMEASTKTECYASFIFVSFVFAE